MEQPHKQLEVWKKSIEISKLIYRVTEFLPKDEQFGLISQMRRASVSIASNIAEGAARNTPKEFVQFLHHAQGSLSELDTQLIISYELGYIKKQELETMVKELQHESKMITGLIKSLRNKIQA